MVVIKFPFTSMQQFNLDWIMQQLHKMLQFMPMNGVAGDVLQRNVDGAVWMPLTSVSLDIHSMSTIPEVEGADELAIYDNSLQGNYKGTIADILALVPASPVSSVNGQTGAVVLSIPSDTSDLTNGAGFVDAAGAAAAAPVQSVNGQTGSVSLSIPSLGYYYIVYNTPIQPGGTNINYSFSDLGIPDDETVLLVQIRQYHYGTLDDVYHSLFIGWTFNNVSRTISARIYSTRTNSANSQLVFEALTIK